MSAKSKAQLRKAGAACGRGEKWGCDMVKHTPKGAAKHLPERKGKRRGK